MLFNLSCQGTGGGEGGGGGGKATGIVSVTEKNNPGTAGGGLFKGENQSPKGVSQGEKVSFIPDSLKITIRGMYVCPHIVVEDGQRTCGPHQPLIEITGEKEIELIGQEGFSPLFSFTTDVPESLFGNYQGALLLNTGEIKVSGSISVAGDTYTFSDLVVPLGYTGLALDMPSPATIDANSSAVFQAIFDVDNAVVLAAADVAASPQCAELPDNPEVKVCADDFTAIPYVGEDIPGLQEYDVQFHTDQFGDSNKYRLKISMFIDPDGNLAAAAWHLVYFEGYQVASGGIEPCDLYIPDIKKSEDSTYILKSTDDTSYCPESRKLVFSAFKLETHDGQLTYGSTTYDYTATKRE